MTNANLLPVPMILTNALLQYGFAIIAGFTNVVQVPADAVPTRVEDLGLYYVGHYGSPTDLSLRHRRGTCFGIEKGAVRFFNTPGSYLNLQDPELIPRFFGKATLSSNQVLELATRTVERLARTTNPIVNVIPVVKSARKYRGREIPVYEITWPKPYYAPFGYFAGVEVDARTGQITYLELHDPSFYNYTLAQEISNKVCIAESPPANSPAPRPFKFKRLFPCPTTNEVQNAIASWRWLCGQLEIRCGDESLATVNWDRTCVNTNELFDPPSKEYVTRFISGASFAAVNGIARSHNGVEAYFYQHSNPRLPAFQGRITYTWRDLASKLERLLLQQIAVPKRELARCKPHLASAAPAQLGSVAFNRAAVEWTDPNQKAAPFAFTAEFDLSTGEIRQVAFFHPGIIQALRSAQGRVTH